MKDFIRNILIERKKGNSVGIPSYCTANKQVIKSILLHAKETKHKVLLEATSNQVNQFGGYTGMKPVDYRNYIYRLAEEISCPKEYIILGGDHLGPLVWCGENEEEAMSKAKELVRLFTLAGYTKIHLDTSMRLGSDNPLEDLKDETIARRGVELYKVSLDAYRELIKENPNAPMPSYIIGSEVPIPGGAQEKEDSIEVTKPEALTYTLEAYKEEFERQGVSEGFENVVAVVVQPGIEFGDNEIHVYDRKKAKELCLACESTPVMLEGHSTDYQPKTALKEMVEDGVGILKVGPQLTFAFREAMFSLSSIEEALLDKDGLIAGRTPVRFPDLLEELMLDNPADWEKHYHGSEYKKKIERKYSLSDRSRYYMSNEKIEEAIKLLYENIDSVDIPLGLLHQFMPVQCDRVINGSLDLKADSLVVDYIKDVIRDYEYAVGY